MTDKSKKWYNDLKYLQGALRALLLSQARDGDSEWLSSCTMVSNDDGIDLWLDVDGTEYGEVRMVSFSATEEPVFFQLPYSVIDGLVEMLREVRAAYERT